MDINYHVESMDINYHVEPMDINYHVESMDINYHVESMDINYHRSITTLGVQLIGILAKQGRKVTILLNLSDSFICP